MTNVAFLFCMRNRQVISCKIMVKCCRIKTNKLEVFPVMLAVAIQAFLTLHIGRCMVSLLKEYPVIDLSMAGKAFIVRDLITHYMAFGAVGYARQV